MSRVRVAIFEPYMFDLPYGNLRGIRTVFDLLDRERFEPFLVAPRRSRFLEEIEARGGPVRVVEAPERLLSFGGALLRQGPLGRVASVLALAAYSRKLFRFFREERVQVVQCQNLRGLLLAGPAAKAAGAKLIWYVKGHLENPLLDRIGFLLADRILFQNEASLARRYPGLVRRLRGKITILWNGIDLEEAARAEERAGPGLGEALGLDPAKLNLVYLGQIAPPKGLEDLLQALALVQSRAPAALYLAGEHGAEEYRSYRGRLEDLVREKGLLDVRFLGWRSDALEVLSLMDVLVLPSLSEGAPKCLLEAMALGKPVVATRVGGVPGLVDERETGLLVEPGDPPGLAAAILALAGDRGLRERMGRRARVVARERYPAGRNVRGLEEVWSRLAARPAGSPPERRRRKLFENRWHRNYLIRRYLYGPFLRAACRLLYGARFLIPRRLVRLERPIFVVGVSRSGTTVFMDHFRRHRDLCNWSEAAQVLELDFYDPEIDTQKRAEDLLPSDAFRLRALFGGKARLLRKPRFVNKHPENSLRIGWLKAVFPDALFVHMIREGRATVESNHSRTLKDPFRRGWPFGQFPKPPRWRSYLERPLLEQFAHQWVDLIEHIRAEARSVLRPEEYLELRYEDFCARTHAVLERVDAFCGLPWSGRRYREIPERFESQNGRWRRTLSPLDLARVEAVIGPLNRSLGYGEPAHLPAALEGASPR